MTGGTGRGVAGRAVAGVPSPALTGTVAAGTVAPGTVAPGTDPAAQPGSPLPMQLWRRVDWRFLLPGLDLGRVLCAGQVDPDLPAALQLAGADVGSLPADSAFDLVVLVQPSAADLATAIAAVRPGGWVYAEVRRHAGSRSAGPRTLLDCHRDLRRAGLRDTEAFWHAPDFASCTRIVPLASHAGVRNALRRHQAVRFGAAKALAGRVALAGGLFPLAVAEGSVIGRRPAAGEPVAGPGEAPGHR